MQHYFLGTDILNSRTLQSWTWNTSYSFFDLAFIYIYFLKLFSKITTIIVGILLPYTNIWSFVIGTTSNIVVFEILWTYISASICGTIICISATLFFLSLHLEHFLLSSILHRNSLNIRFIKKNYTNSLHLACGTIIPASKTIFINKWNTWNK